jgi:HlyD family secretion protein
VLGLGAILSAALGFGVWANSAPIAGAVVTSGVFVTVGQNKIVQHLEGGVIREILVSEGDVVEPGQTLMLLDETGPNAELRRLFLRHARLQAVDARLRAEMAEVAEIAFPASLLELAHDPDVGNSIDAQRLTFEARRRSLTSEIAAVKAGVDALEERMTGSQAQLASVRRQLELIDEELKGKAQLLQGGMIRRPEVLALQRAQANLQGEVGRLVGELGDARERVVRAREQIEGLRNASRKAAVEQLQEIQAERKDLAERLRSAQGILDRIRITAPVRGVVVKMRYHTAGGVVEAGKNVLEIVPLHEGLIIEARVRPQDISTVKRGQSAAVRLTALKARVTPMVSGEVVYVSADALPDERKGLAAQSDVYIARVKLDPDEASRLPDFVPTAGMPAEVYIKTAERTFFEYLMQPLRDSMSRAFRES